MKKAVTLLLLLAVFTASCIFRDDMQALTHNKWRMKSWTVVPEYMGETDLYAQLPACKKDDFLNFEYESVLITDEGATKCNDNDPQTVNSYWHMNDDKTELTLYNDSTSTIYSVKNINRNNLELETTFEEDTAGTTYTWHITYKAM
ncbi:hypothetical protein C7N43_13960 [Sphingobacteriales bacterium UPWRP_1]|nr:hypothetical protein B6N25_10075 [Sphingobacteriales bacterium TSM_CSS]PSJ76404.1 hypothetical protein C7N43_13960 [Sphingobacteriales bacterium UPWRP_1]